MAEGSNVAAQELESLLQRVENLKEQQAEIAEDIKEVKAEAKARGYDMKAFSVMLSLRAKDAETRKIIGLYADRLDIFG